MVPPRAMTLADVGGGVSRPWDAAAADVLLEEQAHGLLDGGDGVAGGAVVSVECAVEQPLPERCRVGVLTQDLGGLGGGRRFGDPGQDVLEAAAGQRGRVEVGLQDLGRLGRVEPGGVVARGRRRCRP